MRRSSWLAVRVCLYLTAIAVLALCGRGVIGSLIPAPGAGAEPGGAWAPAASPSGAVAAPPPVEAVPPGEVGRILERHRAACAATRARVLARLDGTFAPVHATFLLAAGRADAYADWACGLGPSCRAAWRSARAWAGAVEHAPDGVQLTAQQLFEAEFGRQVLAPAELDQAIGDAFDGARRLTLAAEVELAAAAEADATGALRTFVPRVDATRVGRRAFGPCREAATEFLPRVALARLGYEAGSLLVLQPIAASLVASALSAAGVGGGGTLLGVGAGWWTAGLSLVAVVGVDLAVMHYAKGGIAETVRAELARAERGLLGTPEMPGELRAALRAALEEEFDRFAVDSEAALRAALAP
ncbi:MAG: hypothetical protein HZA54_06440 [Planctomycetes bacterium]|nr:hypothetical protein [Planctomycetota bacterium]